MKVTNIESLDRSLKLKEFIRAYKLESCNLKDPSPNLSKIRSW